MTFLSFSPDLHDLPKRVWSFSDFRFSGRQKSVTQSKGENKTKNKAVITTVIFCPAAIARAVIIIYRMLLVNMTKWQ